MLEGSVVQIGSNVGALWTFAAGVLVVYMLAAMVLMGVAAVKRFLDA